MTYERAKQMTVAAISPVSCVHHQRLCPNGSGLGMVLNLLHSKRSQTSDGRHQQRCGRLIEQFARCQTHQTENKFLVTDYLIRRCQLRRAQCLGNQIDNHRIEHAEKQPYRHRSQCRGTPDGSKAKTEITRFSQNAT